MTIYLGNQEFIDDRSNNLSLFLDGKDSGDIFVGVACSGSPSLHAFPEESTGEDNSASSEGGSSGFPISQGCNVVTSTVPIATTTPLESTPVSSH
jgi:hypothetical protein